MSYHHEAGLALGTGYGGQASALTAQVKDNTGSVLLNIPTFVEVGANTGIYVADVSLGDSWTGVIVYTWTGSPALASVTEPVSPPKYGATTPSWYTAPPTDYQQRGVAVTLPARDFTTIIPLNSPHGSEGEALLAARAQGAGTWSRTGNVIHLLAPDKTTVLFTLTFDDITNPLLRTET